MGEDIVGGMGGDGETGRLGRRARRHQGALRQASATGVLDTPLSESAFIGAAIGAAACGMRPVAELMFIDFMGVCFDQIFNQAAKFKYMFGGKAADAGGHPHHGRCRLPRRRPALADADAALHPHPGLEGRLPVQRLRRQGPADPVDPRQRSGDLLRAQESLRRRRATCRRRSTPSRSARRTSCAKASDVTIVTLAGWCTSRWRRRDALAKKASSAR